MLYIVATPIGNLKDFTYRAVECLKTCDLILCEDTRTTQVLLKEYQIHTKLAAWHKFNEKKQLNPLIRQLKEGKNIALVSDAGMPLISDPGFILVQTCQKENISYTCLPGPSSILNALVLSGMDPARFQFIGFLPKKQAEKIKTIHSILLYPGLTICFESANRLIESLKVIHDLDSQRTISITREMTKKFEEIKTNTAINLIEHFTQNPCKGEITIVVQASVNYIPDISAQELIDLLQKYHGCSVKEAIKISAKLLNKRKNEIYQKHHSK